LLAAVVVVVVAALTQAGVAVLADSGLDRLRFRLKAMK
jgi:hypothetical protein